VSLPLFLALLAVITGLVISRWRWPLRPCPRCRGKGVNRGSTGKRYGRCRRCKGTKQVRRVGATAVHRFFWSVAGAAAKGRMQKRVEKARDKARYPES
jgi:DnaJ-class molecular chaperone